LTHPQISLKQLDLDVPGQTDFSVQLQGRERRRLNPQGLHFPAFRFRESLKFRPCQGEKCPEPFGDSHPFAKGDAENVALRIDIEVIAEISADMGIDDDAQSCHFCRAEGIFNDNLGRDVRSGDDGPYGRIVNGGRDETRLQPVEKPISGIKKVIGLGDDADAAIDHEKLSLAGSPFIHIIDPADVVGEGVPIVELDRDMALELMITRRRLVKIIARAKADGTDDHAPAVFFLQLHQFIEEEVHSAVSPSRYDCAFSPVQFLPEILDQVFGVIDELVVVAQIFVFELRPDGFPFVKRFPVVGRSI